MVSFATQVGSGAGSIHMNPSIWTTAIASASIAVSGYAINEGDIKIDVPTATYVVLESDVTGDNTLPYVALTETIADRSYDHAGIALEFGKSLLQNMEDSPHEFMEAVKEDIWDLI